MSFFTDIAILDKQGAPAALVEVKGKLGTTPDWAAALRRNLAGHRLMPNAKFFVLATPDRLYFWVNKTTDALPVPPDFFFDPDAALQPYYTESGVQPGELAESSFELLLASWLSELTRGSGEERVPRDASDWLGHSGFLAAIQGGRVEHQR